MPPLEAVIWDVDGTLADTERDGHRVAFNRAFETEGLPWRWDEALYCRLLSVTGGRERILADMAHRVEAPTALEEREALALCLHTLKNRYYGEIVRAGQVALRPGVLHLIQACIQQQMRMAIATTTSRTNIDALLQAHFKADERAHFEQIVCGEDVRRKKPDPEVYQIVLSAMGLQPAQCVAIEDSPAGAAAARAAGIPVLVTRSGCFEQDTFEAVLACGPHLGSATGWSPPATRTTMHGGVGLEQIRIWHAQATPVPAQPHHITP
jgi:HAD superfamily hydrolase (TIGR01509 family)